MPSSLPVPPCWLSAPIVPLSYGMPSPCTAVAYVSSCQPAIRIPSQILTTGCYCYYPLTAPSSPPGCSGTSTVCSPNPTWPACGAPMLQRVCIEPMATHWGGLPIYFTGEKILVGHYLGRLPAQEPHFQTVANSSAFIRWVGCGSGKGCGPRFILFSQSAPLFQLHAGVIPWNQWMVL